VRNRKRCTGHCRHVVEFFRPYHRAYKQGNEYALDDAVWIAEELHLPEQEWMIRALTERSRAEILRKPRERKKPGDRNTFWRNHLWFTLVQMHREEGQKYHVALDFAQEEINQGCDEVKPAGNGTESLERIYKHMRRLVDRVPGLPACDWPFRKGVYVPFAAPDANGEPQPAPGGDRYILI
jgi:hypothetical protein